MIGPEPYSLSRHGTDPGVARLLGMRMCVSSSLDVAVGLPDSDAICLHNCPLAISSAGFFV